MTIGDQHNQLSERIIGAAIEVHRHLGPGLLESAYQRCLAAELLMRGVDFRSEVALPIRYKGLTVDCSYRLDFVVEDAVIVEVKAVDALDGIHTAQVLTYLRLLKLELGLLINFNVPTLWRGVRRVANSLPAISAAADSPRSHGGHGGHGGP